MSHLRYDVTTHDWVIFATERTRRPHDLPPRPEQASDTSTCPFCPGKEGETHWELFRIPDPHRPETWSVRAVANKFPALTLEAKGGFTERGRHFQQYDGYGAHEVIVESPDHFTPMALQSRMQIERVLVALQTRYRALMLDRRLRSIILFKNHGAAAGTSLKHPHWQILATPLVPRMLRQRHDIATDYFDRNFKCLHNVLLEEELSIGSRVLAMNEAFAAVLPYASHLPYQVRILPRVFQASFSQASWEQLGLLASLLKEVMGRLYTALGDPAFNLTFVSPPIGDEDEDYFLWHIDILPRLFTQAGFEMGSGMSINPILPETAAQELRDAALPAG
ncbi:MAG: galT [Fibrobacteres bacterium]|nr:galT [Fibrobacterota bacterium]